MVFARFMTIYGHKLKSVFESEDEIRIAKREWALSLGGYSEQQLVQAVNRCKEEFVWMPTISEFLSLLRVRPEELGLPSEQAAYLEACEFADDPLAHEWRHPAVYFAGKATDWYRLRTEDKDQVFSDFQFNYRQLCQRVIEGESLEVPVPRGLPNKQSNTLAAFINEWSADQGVTPEQAATLLFYLTKPRHSPVRAHFKAHAQQQAEDWGLAVELPEDYQ